MSAQNKVAVGAVAGLLGAGLAHALTVFADRAGSEQWLRGPYGPQFFNVALYTGVFYAAIGWAAGRRALTALVGFAGTFFGILLPMFILTRYAGWGMPRTANAVTPQWQIAVLVVYIASIWGTIAGLGALAGPGKAWKGALAAVLGSLAGYAVLALCLKAFGGLLQGRWAPNSLMPPPVNLLDGTLSGAGLCLALSLDESISRRPS